jgi:hypothetical protein
MEEYDRRPGGRAELCVPDVQDAGVDLLQRAE